MPFPLIAPRAEFMAVFVVSAQNFSFAEHAFVLSCPAALAYIAYVGWTPTDLCNPLPKLARVESSSLLVRGPR